VCIDNKMPRPMTALTDINLRAYTNIKQWQASFHVVRKGCLPSKCYSELIWVFNLTLTRSDSNSTLLFTTSWKLNYKLIKQIWCRKQSLFINLILWLTSPYQIGRWFDRCKRILRFKSTIFCSVSCNLVPVSTLRLSVWNNIIIIVSLIDIFSI